MLDDSTSEYDHATFLGSQRAVIEQTDVLHQVDDEASLSPSVEVHDVAEGSVSEGGAEDRNFVLPTPVVDAIFIVNFFTDACDDFRW